MLNTLNDQGFSKNQIITLYRPEEQHVLRHYRLDLEKRETFIG